MPDASRAVLLGGAVLVAATLLLRHRYAPRIAMAGLIALAVIDLASSTRIDFRRPSQSLELFDTSRQLFDFVKQNQGLDRTYIATTEVTPGLMAKQGTLRGIYSITDYEPLSLLRYDRFYRVLEPPDLPRPEHRTFTGALQTDGTSPMFRLLDLMSVRFVAAPTGAAALQLVQPGNAPKWRVAFRATMGDSYTLMENANVLPRAYVAHEVVAAPSEDEALEAIQAETFDPRQSVVLEIPRDEEARPGNANRAPGISLAEIKHYEATSVVIETRDAAPGWLVLTDTAYPGWRAHVDGAPAAIVTANYLFRAVRVPAGSHSVTFEYEPTSVRLGLALTAGAWVAILAYGVAQLVRRSRHRVA
jgi:hypothetical protein